MKIKNYFHPIYVPEKEDYQQYIFTEHLKVITFNFGKLYLRIFDEIEQYIVRNNKFYKTEDCLKRNKELQESKIYFYNEISGLTEEITIIKRLGWQKGVEGVYEIRLNSDYYVIRLLIFPYSEKNTIFKERFVTLSYVFDKRTSEDGNQLTNELRDSTFRIKLSFKDDKQIINYLIDNRGEKWYGY